MTINKAIIHIFDFQSGISTFSQETLDLADKSISDYIEKHITRAINNSSKSNGNFRGNSQMLSLVKKYSNGEMDFLDITHYIGELLYDQVAKSDKVDSSDLIIVDCIEDEVPYIVILFPVTRNAYIHFVSQNNGVISNKIVNNKAVLPSVTQKIESYAIINCNDYSLSFCDKRRYIDGKDCFVIPDILLECTTEPSSKEIVSAVSKIAEKVAAEYAINSTVTLSKAKTYIVENSEVSDHLCAKKLGEAIFPNDETQKAFEKELSRQNIPEDVVVNRSLAIRTGKSHKIKTDTGIEISFPSEYVENSDFIEIINNPNGTLSIELKNIGKILNR